MTVSLDSLTPDTKALASAFLSAANRQGLNVVLGSTLRSCASQGTSTTPVIVQGMSLKRAVGCRSWHVWGRAFDVTLVEPSPERYAMLGALGKSMGLQWGGDFVSNPDPIHFQNPGGLDIHVLCPDPLKCDEAVAAYLASHGVSPSPVPPLQEEDAGPTMNGWSFVSFALGMAAGWAVTRRLRR